MLKFALTLCGLALLAAPAAAADNPAVLKAVDDSDAAEPAAQPSWLPTALAGVGKRRRSNHGTLAIRSPKPTSPARRTLRQRPAPLARRLSSPTFTPI